MQNVAISLRWDQIFIILFVVFDPLKVVGRFAALTRDTEETFRRQLARRTTLFAAIGVVVGCIIGQRTLASWGIHHAILLLAGGIIWFLVAVLAVMRPYLPAFERETPVGPPTLALALTPLAFPTIVTPYGIATLIVLLATMNTLGEAMLLLALTGVMLLLNWLAMIYARPILRLFAIPLELVSWVLGVLQVALAVDLIYIALSVLSMSPFRA